MKTARQVIKSAHVKSNIALIAVVIGAAIAGWLLPRYIINRPFTPSDYINHPLEVNIPVKYILSVDMGMIVKKYTNMNITCYTNRVEECDSTPNHTATGRIVYEGSCAISQDLFRKEIFPGDIVYVEKLKKYFMVEDTMAVQSKSGTLQNTWVDIFMYRKDLKKAGDFGLQKSNVYIIRLNGKVK